MQVEKYTDRLKTLVQSAQSLALRSGHQQFSTLHVLKALLDDEEHLAANLIAASGGDASRISQAQGRATSEAQVPGAPGSKPMPKPVAISAAGCDSGSPRFLRAATARSRPLERRCPRRGR